MDHMVRPSETRLFRRSVPSHTTAVCHENTFAAREQDGLPRRCGQMVRADSAAAGAALARDLDRQGLVVAALNSLNQN